MKFIKYISFLIIFLIISVFPVSSLTVKLGSVAPVGSDWDLALKQLSNDWRTLTNGQVNVKIYPGGIAGSEDNMIQKMRIGQLDMAVLTAIGMNNIVPETFVLSLPFLLNNDEEVNYMLDNITPIFDDNFRAKGFEVLMWASTGWIHFFSKEKATSPDLLRKLKIGVAGSETEMIDAWKSLNFKIIPMSINDTMSGLQSGMIEAFYAPPMGAAAYQWFAFTPHMNEIQISPLLGGIVISQRTWNRIPSRYHEDLKQAVLNANSQFNKYSKEMNAEALDVMLDNGLQVDSLTENEKRLWESLFDNEYSAIVGPGKLIPSETLHMVKKMIEDFRAAE
ncbi:MAG: TRAP transporter substrate-binding protein DctP [Spirochaetaceae bacterium]|jgi:TRAP-type C4-dicarboxylate transport system substrate-binding protein|nr:TRAP transporter substrate-binding protein DctP [Spirochaetaceae bacterium]